jgi:50S ribosomal subunit-associated GTPase HflX
LVWNKCDLVTETISSTSGVAVSALKSDGMENLLLRISQLRDDSLDWFRLTLDNPGEDVVSWLHRNCLVRKFTRTGGNIEMIGAIATGSVAVRKYLSTGEIDFRLAPWSPPGDDVQSNERTGETSDG